MGKLSSPIRQIPETLGVKIWTRGPKLKDEATTRWTTGVHPGAWALTVRRLRFEHPSRKVEGRVTAWKAELGRGKSPNQGEWGTSGVEAECNKASQRGFAHQWLGGWSRSCALPMIIYRLHKFYQDWCIGIPEGIKPFILQGK